MAPKWAKEDELLPNRSSESADPRPLRIVGDGGDALPRAAAGEAPRGTLPIELTSFVGRGRELAEVEALLGTTRLLTITGPGGCGKKRLALRMAADLADGFSGGTFFVGLASLTDPDLVPQAVARVLVFARRRISLSWRRSRNDLRSMRRSFWWTTAST
jgi:hypothetical protein